MAQRSVLCAIDVNDFDQVVIDLAAEFALQFGVGLDLVHVTTMPDPAKLAWPAYVGAPNELIRDNRLFREVKPTVSGVDFARHHLSGFPVSKVVEFVEEHKPLLLVLGTHSRRGIGRILGSTAAKIMRRVCCPVMVYRQRNSG